MPVLPVLGAVPCPGTSTLRRNVAACKVHVRVTHHCWGTLSVAAGMLQAPNRGGRGVQGTPQPSVWGLAKCAHCMLLLRLNVSCIHSCPSGVPQLIRYAHHT